jgi:MEDS: MEthanogen/methylotroph, DcmR Sensory domain
LVSPKLGVDSQIHGIRMAAASTEIPGGPGERDLLEPGIHAAYFFDTHSEKQLKLFSLCRGAVDDKNCYLIYVAGKQGVKGIRLSLKDTGFDVAAYEKKQQMKIIDSEELFLTMGRQQTFRPAEELVEKITGFEKEALNLGYSGLVILCETDMLVRKGYLGGYKEFDTEIGRLLPQTRITLLCAFDKRELTARGVQNPEAEIGPLHNLIV